MLAPCGAFRSQPVSATMATKTWSPIRASTVTRMIKRRRLAPESWRVSCDMASPSVTPAERSSPWKGRRADPRELPRGLSGNAMQPTCHGGDCRNLRSGKARSSGRRQIDDDPARQVGTNYRSGYPRPVNIASGRAALRPPHRRRTTRATLDTPPADSRAR